MSTKPKRSKIRKISKNGKVKHMGPTVIAADPGFSYVYPAPSGEDNGRVTQLFSSPIIAWLFEPACNSNGCFDPNWTPVSLEGIYDGPWAIRLPDGQICFPGETTFDDEKSAIDHFNRWMDDPSYSSPVKTGLFGGKT